MATGKAKRQEEKQVQEAEITASPLQGILYYTTLKQKMNRKGINILLAALVILNILDGDFSDPGVLDAAKLILLIICFILNNRRNGNVEN